MRRAIVLPLVASLCTALEPAAVIPHPPGITAAPLEPFVRRQADDIVTSVVSIHNDVETRPDFKGWYMTNSNQAQFCDGGKTWSTSASFGGCCATNEAGGCTPVTKCADASVMVDAEGGSATCGDGFQCGRVTIYSAYPSISPVYDFLCANNLWSAWTMYRHISTTDSSSLPTSTPSSDPSAASQTSPGSSNTAPPITTGLPGADGDSKAWVAGAVVGPIIGLALIGALGFFFWRRHQQAKYNPISEGGFGMGGDQSYDMHQQAAAPYGQGGMGQNGGQYYSDHVPSQHGDLGDRTSYMGAAGGYGDYTPVAEVGGASAAQELGGGEVRRH